MCEKCNCEKTNEELKKLRKDIEDLKFDNYELEEDNKVLKEKVERTESDLVDLKGYLFEIENIVKGNRDIDEIFKEVNDIISHLEYELSK